MSATEEDKVIQHQSRGAGKLESEFETESFVESVVRGEKEATGSGEKDETEEAGSGADVPKVCAFDAKNVDNDVDSEDVERQAETGTLDSATSDDRHGLDYLANKKGNLFLEIDRWPAFSR